MNALALRRLARWFASRRIWDWLFGNRPHLTSTKPRFARLRLEALEERVMPTVTALPDFYSTGFAQPLTVQAAGILANDSTDSGQPLSAAQLTQPMHGTAAVNSDGSLQYNQTDFTFAGIDQLNYDATDGLSTSAPATIFITVAKAATTTTLTALANPVAIGDPVTLTASVTTSASNAGVPTGVITFMEGNTPLGVVLLDSSGTAAFTTSALALGDHDIVAVYTANGVFASGTSDPLTVTVSQAWIDQSQDDILVGDTVTFTAYPADSDPSSIQNVEWDMHYDGTTFHADAAYSGLESVDWNFSAPETSTIAAEITTTSGHVQLATLDVNAHFPPPTLTVPGDMTVTAGNPVDLIAVAQPTGGATITGTQWWFSFNGGDYEQDTSQTGLVAHETFADFGMVDVWLKVTDSNDQTAEDGFTVFVTERPPTPTITATGPQGAIDANNHAVMNEGQTATFTVTGIDINQADDLTIWADWKGTGTYEIVDVSDWYDNGHGSISFDHAYDDNNGRDSNAQQRPYLVQFLVQDEGGDYTALAPVSVMVRNVAPIGTLVAGTGSSVTGQDNLPVYAIFPGDPVKFTNVYDPTNPDTEELTYHWIVNGGAEVQTDTEELTLDEVAHAYDYGAVDTIQAWITDKDGGASEAKTIEVAVWPAMPLVGHLHGEMLPTEFLQTTNTSAVVRPDDLVNYDKYSNQVWRFDLVMDAQNNSKPFGVWMRLDQASLTSVPLGQTVNFHWTVQVWDVEQHWYGDDHDLISTENFDGPANGLNLSTYPQDREIVVTCTPTLDDGGSGGGVGSIGGGGGQAGFTHTLVFDTSKTPTTWSQVRDTLSILRDLATQFADLGQRVLNAIGNDPWDFFSNLGAGLANGVGKFISSFVTDPSTVTNAAARWITNGALTSFDTDQALSQLLQYSGLTWNGVKASIVQAVGASNAAAAGLVASWFAAYDVLNIPDTDKIIQFFRDKADVIGTSLSDVKNALVTAVTSKLEQSLDQIAPALAAKFASGAGPVRALYQGFTWVLNNYQSMVDLVNRFVNALDVVGNADAFGTQVKNILTDSVPLLMSFLANQLGLGNLPNEIRSAVQAVPDFFYKKLAVAVAGLAISGVPSGPLYAGALAPMQTVQTGQYQLWTARDSTTKQVSVKVAQQVNGSWKLYTTLTDASFTGNDPKTHARALLTAAQNYAAELDRQKKTPTPDGATRLANLQAAVANAQNVLAGDIANNACAALGVGCFAAGTELWTPDGFRKIEEILCGQLVFARNEFDPSGPIEAKVVDEVFARFSEIIHFHVGGEVIRTTSEHPFFAISTTREQGRWTRVDELHPGDRILTEAGEWKEVQEVFHTGEWEKVYNLRVADYHTYFVGEAGWGWCAWAHNAYRVTHQFTQGSVIQFTFNGYCAEWYVPSAFLTAAGLPNQAVQQAVAQDVKNGWGNTLQGLVTQYAADWDQLAWNANGKAEAGREAAIRRALNDANNIYLQVGMNPVTYQAFMTAGGSLPHIPDSCPPGLGMTAAQYNALKRQHGIALHLANQQRAAARGDYMHGRLDAYAQTHGYQYFPQGIDLLHTSSGLRFEAMVTGSWADHSGPAFQQTFWRALQY
jgi:hypothetical protein